jgi:hypothetical protein
MAPDAPKTLIFDRPPAITEPLRKAAAMIIDPLYSIGIDEMDAQHARWIQLIEEFKAVAS